MKVTVAKPQHEQTILQSIHSFLSSPRLFQAFNAIFALVGVISQSGQGVLGHPQVLPPAAAAPAVPGAPNERPPLYFQPNSTVTTDLDCKLLADELLRTDEFRFPSLPFFVLEEKSYAAEGVERRKSDVCALRPGKGWHVETGYEGNCSDGCCEYLPPNEEGAPLFEPAPLVVSWTIVDADGNCDGAAAEAKLKAQVLRGGVRLETIEK